MSKHFNSSRADIYTRITDDIVAAMERGVGALQSPWRHDGGSIFRPCNVASAKTYRGVNILALWASSQANGFSCGTWGTYQQWSERGAQVRKGERATSVVFWKISEKGQDAADQSAADDAPSRRMFARGYSVFNADQVDGFVPAEIPVLSDAERCEEAERFITALKIKIILGGQDAYYQPSTDSVHLPDFDRFRDAASFYAVSIHECGHATGSKHRLDRNLSGRFGSAAYAAEELCVELASAFLLADFGIAHEPREDHAAYIASWMQVLTDDPRAIFTAASKAQAIADWMHAQQPNPEPG